MLFCVEYLKEKNWLTHVKVPCFCLAEKIRDGLRNEYPNMIFRIGRIQPDYDCLDIYEYNVNYKIKEVKNETRKHSKQLKRS